MERMSSAHPKKSESKQCVVGDGLKATSNEIKTLSKERKHVEEEKALERWDIVFDMAIGIA